MVDFILQNWIILLGGGSITGIVGWFLGGRDKTNIELRKNNADATVTIQSMYQTFALQYESQYKAVLLELAGLRKEVIELSLINAITKEAADSWEKKFNELQKEHDQLKKAFDNLKKSMK